MKQKEMEKIIAHFDQYFEQSDSMVLHPVVDGGYHVDVLLYSPSKKYPFWKLVTMGASDYKMPKIANTISQYNEYIMFVHSDEDLNDRDILSWYHNKLLMIASFAYYNQTHITYAHSFEWENEDADDEMVAAFIEFPQVVEDIGMLRCKLGMLKTVACLQTVLLNREELDRLMQIGPQAFSEYLYPDDDGKQHFLSERHRSDRF
jgi:hypothetical protein